MFKDIDWNCVGQGVTVLLIIGIAFYTVWWVYNRFLKKEPMAPTGVDYSNYNLANMRSSHAADVAANATDYDRTTCANQYNKDDPNYLTNVNNCILQKSSD